MNFSKEICPICGGKLKETNPHEGDIYVFMPTKFYCCEKLVLVRNHANTQNHFHTHYYRAEFEGFKSYNAKLIYPPYVLYYSFYDDWMTINLIRPYNSEINLFEIPPLKLNYSDSEKVKQKIKLLLPFS